MAAAGNRSLAAQHRGHDAEGRPINPIQFFAPSMTPHEYQKLLREAEESAIALD